MQQSKTKQLATRWVIYLVGMFVLVAGITLNTKTGLGAAAIVSVAHTISLCTGFTLGNISLVTYVLFIAAQFVLKGSKRNWLDLLQLVVSVVFTRVMDFMKAAVTYQSGQSLVSDLLLLVLAIVLTGTGAAMVLSMELIPNPADGIVNALSMRSGKEVGICKSCFDIVNVAASFPIGLFNGNALMGIGIGTVISMLCIGRYISIFNKFFRHKLRAAAGLEEPVTAA